MAVLNGWRLCPRCGAELDLTSSPARVSCPACGFVAYANPKPAANAFVVDDAGRVLLARRAHEPSLGLWDLPGGFVEEGEHPLETLRRELREETGLEVEPDTFVGLWMDVYGDGADAESTLCLYWTVRPGEGEPQPADSCGSSRTRFRPVTSSPSRASSRRWPRGGSWCRRGRVLPGPDQTARPSERSIALLGCAPTTAAAGSPFLKRIIVGIEATP